MRVEGGDERGDGGGGGGGSWGLRVEVVGALWCTAGTFIHQTWLKKKTLDVNVNVRGWGR